MRTVIKKYDVYKFDELNEQAQEKVIDDYIDWYIYEKTQNKEPRKNSNLYKAFKKAKDLQTPWFLRQFVFDYCEKDILKEVKKYEYYENGGMYYED